MRTIADQISALETARAAKAAAMQAVMQRGMDEARSTSESEQEEFDTLETEVTAIDGDLTRLRTLERVTATKARPVNATAATTAAAGTEARSPIIIRQPKLEPGINFARLVKINYIARKDNERAIDVALRMYGAESEIAQWLQTRAAVGAGNTGGDLADSPAGWGGALVGAESGPVGDFAEFLRPLTILGKFGTPGIPDLTRVPFRVALVTQTTGGQGYWVGEGRAKPLTLFDFTRTTLEPLKVANITTVTMELLRDSRPQAEPILRNQLARALAQRLDIDFVDPNNAGTTGIKPASITNGVTPIVSTGTDAAGARKDVAAALQGFVNANNPPTQGVWLMPSSIAMQLGLMMNALGQPEFPGISMAGGTFMGLPVIASEFMPHDSAGAVVALVNASDIYLGDEGGFNVDMSTEASLEMSDTPTANSIPPTVPGTQMVSMFQTNSVALRAERTISWKRRRNSGVQVLTDVDWAA